MSETIAVILAAGRGTRMKSDLPKVLFPVLGRPMIHWVLDALAEAGVRRSIAVIGYQADAVRDEIAGRNGVSFVLQERQLGTGHAVEMCRDELRRHEGSVLIVAGDSPLIQPSSVSQLITEFHRRELACLLGTLIKDDPSGLGRIIRDDSGRFQRIVEQKDASSDEVAIKEVNMSTYLFDCNQLLWALSQLNNDNSQGEYYLTDCPEILRRAGQDVDALPVLQPCESLSVNTIDELELVESQMQQMGYEAKHVRNRF